MCGICGVLYFEKERPVERDLLERMNRSLVHRGPDDEGYYVGKGIGLAMRRLSIIDVTGGHQPMENEDGTCWIIFNGEIFNYLPLREELIAKGHRFRTGSDTEVILHLYEEEGKDCPKRLNGMFAFAIWDERRGELFIARDRLGVKPLYSMKDGARFLFGSDQRSRERSMRQRFTPT